MKCLMEAENFDSGEEGRGPEIFTLESERTDLGQADTLRYNVLSWVLEERYDKAIETLRATMTDPSEFPNYQDRVGRYLKHSVDLIYAIKAKRNFPGITSLTRAKQSELREKFKEHFKELQQVLKKIEKIERDMKIEDARSTIYVVRALWIGALSIVTVAFLLEVTGGMAQTASVVLEDSVERWIDAIFRLIGL